jgi:predicted alpha/beta superfamily hydrolase
MMQKWSVTLPKLTGSEPRSAYVYVPRMCLEDRRLRLPVLYMFDGHNLFTDEDATYGKSWGLKKFLDFHDIPLIVAAVECNHSPEAAKGRLSEYSPFDYNDPVFGPIPGRGKLTMDWMTRVFKPMVDRRFPTLSSRKYTFIGGSSMGGLMSLYALSRYNHVFSRAAALSPSLWVNPEGCMELASNPRMRTDSVIYMDYGSEELRNHPGMLPTFAGVSNQLLSRGVMATTRIVPGGTHTEESWERQLPVMINALLSDF